MQTIKEYLLSNPKFMDKIKKLLRSRQFWTVVALFVLNGVEGVRELLPTSWLPYLNSLLGLLAVFFRVKPRQQF